MLKNGGRLLGGSAAITRSIPTQQESRLTSLYQQASLLPAFLVPAWADVRVYQKPRKQRVARDPAQICLQARTYTTKTHTNKQQEQSLGSSSSEAPASSTFLDMYQADLATALARPSPWYGHIGSYAKLDASYAAKGKEREEQGEGIAFGEYMETVSPEQALLQARYALTVLAAGYTSDDRGGIESAIPGSRFPSAILASDMAALGGYADFYEEDEERPGARFRRKMGYRLAESVRILVDLVQNTQGADIYSIRGYQGLRQALAQALVMTEEEAGHLLSDVNALDRREINSEPLASHVKTVVLIHYWLKLGRRFSASATGEDQTLPPSTSPNVHASGSSTSFSSKDQQRLHRFTRSCVQNLWHTSPRDAVALLRPFMQLHQLDRCYTYKADIPDMQLLIWARSLLAGNLDERTAVRLMLALLMPETAAFAQVQGSTSEEYDRALAGLWSQLRQHIGEDSTLLERDRFVRYGLNQELPLFASQVLVDYLQLASQTDYEANASYLAKLTSKVMSVSLRLGRTEKMEELCQALDATSQSAAVQPNIWQRKLQLLFFKHQSQAHSASPEGIIVDLERLLEQMQAASVPLDAYFLSSLLRGISQSGLPLVKLARLLAAIHSSAEQHSTAKSSATFRLAIAQTDLDMYERAAKQNIQLPWVPLLEQDKSFLQKMPSELSEGAPVHERLAALSTVLRHCIYRKQWGQTLASYEGLLELFSSIGDKQAVHICTMQGAFVRLLSRTLEAHRLQETLRTIQLTLDYLGAHYIGSRAISRAVMAACSPAFYRQARRDGKAASPGCGLVTWSGLSQALQLARDWAQQRNRQESKGQRIPTIDGQSHPPRVLREVFSYWNHLDDLARASLQALFLPANEQTALPSPLEGFKVVIETLLLLDTEVNFEKWWKRLEKQAEELKLPDISHNGEHWLARRDEIKELCMQTQERRRRRPQHHDGDGQAEDTEDRS